jgi:uncharacterized membrane protein YhaH (DUF805 family)
MHALALLLLQDQPNAAQIQHIVMAIVPLIGIFILIAVAIVIIPTWFICKKAGFSPWLSFLCLIPTVGMLVLLYVLAFADWKVAPVQQIAYAPPMPPYPPQR